MKKIIFPILLSTVWISISEFIRNSYLLHNYWIEHYQKNNMIFPAEPINGAIWGIWALLYSIFIFIISQKFSLIHTFIISWFVGFVLMWLVIGNMGVLPWVILPYAMPLSLLEAFFACYIIRKLS